MSLSVIQPSGSGETQPHQYPTATPPILSIEADFDNAASNQAFALAHAAQADAFVAQLGALISSLAPPTINPQFPTNDLNAPAIVVPPVPATLPITYSPPPIPAAFTQTLNVDTTFPDFTAQPPALIFPNAPIPQLGALPSAPALDFNFVYPTVEVDLPAPPSLLSLSLSSFNGVTFPTLNAEAPDIQLVGPQVYNYIAFSPYADTLLTQLKANLFDTLENGSNTMLPAAAEENMWNRSREREYRQQADALADLDRMEAMGFALPPGVYVDARIKIQTETAATLAGNSRDISIEQAKLAQSTMLRAIELANTIEGTLINYYNQRDQRNFDAVKYATDAGIQVYNAEVEGFKAKLEVYRQAIAVYQAQMDGAKLQVQIYQTEIDAEKLKVDANTALVNQYKVGIDAALASIQVFEGEISLLKTRSEIENLKVSAFGEMVKAYAATANVYTAEVEGYKATIEAEQTKEQAYATSASAYSSLVEAKAKEIDAGIATFKALIDAKNEEYTAYKTQVDGATEAVKALAEANTAIAEIYKATVQGTSSYNDAMVKEWEATITLAEKTAELGVQAAQANATLYTTVQGIASEAARGAASVEAQMASAALGTSTYATHRARQDSVSFSNNVGYSASFGTTYQHAANYTEYHYYEEQLLLHQAFNQQVTQSNSTVHNIQSVE